MSFFKIFILILSCFLLAVLQSSFLAGLRFSGFFLNPLLLLVLAYNFWERPDKNFGLFIGFLAGFFLDIFSPLPLGFFSLIFLFLAFSIKRIALLFEKNRLLSFLLAFIFAFLFYGFCLFLSQLFISSVFNGQSLGLFNRSIVYWLFSFALNLFFTLALFSLKQAFFKPCSTNVKNFYGPLRA